MVDVIDLMPDVAADRHEISFHLTGYRSEAACANTREAPEVKSCVAARC
jgi:hypothetical protein